MSISIALTKGRLEKETVKLLDKANYGTEELKDKGRKLVFKDTKKDIKYFYERNISGERKSFRYDEIDKSYKLYRSWLFL